MNTVTNKITLDFMDPDAMPIIHGLQGEQFARTVEVTLFCGGVPWQIPEDAMIAIRYGRVDLTGGYYDTLPDGAPACSGQGNVVFIALVPAMMARAGNVFTQIEIIHKEQKLVTFSFRLQIAGNPAVDVQGPEIYINMQQWLEKELDAYIGEVKESGEFLGGTMAGPINMNRQSLFGMKIPVAADEAANKGYTDSVVRKAAPRNLLDNSDFRSPVNQRGFTGGEVYPNQYCIDRWFNYTNNESIMSVSLTDNGIMIHPCDGDFTQHIPQINKYYGKTMTVAVGLANDTVICKSGVVPSAQWTPFARIDTDWGSVLGHTYNGDKGAFFIHVSKDVTIAWVALYEGEYTLDTLPEYQPKGYGAELAECQRYCIAITGGITIGYGAASSAHTAYMTVDLPVSFHEYTTAIPTISGTFEVRGEGATSVVESANIWNVCGGKAILNCTVLSFYTVHQLYVLRSTSKVLISKDL